jgi:hypothetical protein
MYVSSVVASGYWYVADVVLIWTGTCSKLVQSLECFLSTDPGLKLNTFSFLLIFGLYCWNGGREFSGCIIGDACQLQLQDVIPIRRLGDHHKDAFVNCPEQTCTTFLSDYAWSNEYTDKLQGCHTRCPEAIGRAGGHVHYV